MTSKKKIVKYVVVVSLAAVIGKFAGYAIYEVRSRQKQAELKEARHEVLKALTKQTNIGLPNVINRSTRLDRVISDSETMNLNHTILDAEDWTKVDFEKLGVELPKRVCTDQSMNSLLAMGATVIYSYYDKLGRPLLFVPIRFDQCR